MSSNRDTYSAVLTEDGKNLTPKYREIINTIEKVSQDRRSRGIEPTNTIQIGDQGVSGNSDYDDWLSLPPLSALENAGALKLRGVIVTGHNTSEDTAVTKGFLDRLGMSHVPVFAGEEEYWELDDDLQRRRATDSRRKILSSTNPNTVWQRRHHVDTDLKSTSPGDPLNRTYQEFYNGLSEEAKSTGNKITHIITTGAQTVNELGITSEETGKISMQGGVSYDKENNTMSPDPLARNNKYHMKACQSLLNTVANKNIPSVYSTKNVAFQCSLERSFLDELVTKTGSTGVAKFMEEMVASVDAKFFKDSIRPEDRFAAHLDSSFLIDKKTNLTDEKEKQRIISLFEEKYAKKPKETFTDKMYKEYLKDFDKELRHHMTLTQYDIHAVINSLDIEYHKALGTLSDPDGTELSDFDRTHRTFGKSTDDLGIDVNRVTDVIKALVAHGTILSVRNTESSASYSTQSD